MTHVTSVGTLLVIPLYCTLGTKFIVMFILEREAQLFVVVFSFFSSLIMAVLL